MKSQRTPRKRGAVAVEFAIILPLFVMLLFGMIEFASIGHDHLELDHAAGEGARAAALGRSTRDVLGAVRASAPDIRIEDGQVAIEYGSSADGWTPATNSSDGTTNAVPYGQMVRVRIVDWHHTMLTGGFFSWVAGVDGDHVTMNAQAVGERE